MEVPHELHARLEQVAELAEQEYSRRLSDLRRRAAEARYATWWPWFADELRRITIQYIDAILRGWFSGVQSFDLRCCNERAVRLIEGTYESNWLPAATELAELLTHPSDRPATPSRLFEPFWATIPEHFHLQVPPSKVRVFVDDEHERHWRMFDGIKGKKWDVFEETYKGRVSRSQLSYYFNGQHEGHIRPETRLEIEAAIREFAEKMATT